MKKVFFAFVAATMFVVTACNNKPASTENTATTVDTAKAATSAPAAMDTTMKAADTTAAK